MRTAQDIAADLQALTKLPNLPTGARQIMEEAAAQLIALDTLTDFAADELSKIEATQS